MQNLNQKLVNPRQCCIRLIFLHGTYAFKIAVQILLTPANKVMGQGNVFIRVCLSVQRGEGVGFSACITGRMTRGVCIWGLCPPLPRCRPSPGCRPPMEYYGIRSASGRYESYWNAFLLYYIFYCCMRIKTSMNSTNTTFVIVI